MTKRKHNPTTTTEERHLTATVSVAGAQRAELASFGDGGPGSSVTVVVAGVILWLSDRRTVDVYARLWLASEALIFAHRLPTARALPTQRDGEITIALHARHTDRTRVDPLGDDALVITTGALRRAVYDRDAFDRLQQLWVTVVRLAEIVLPNGAGPTV